MAVQITGISKTISSKIAFEAGMQRAALNQKYWDDLLEKLRKSGGGGGGSSDSRFDRIAVSMMLSNLLSNKTIQAMLRNFTGEFFNSTSNNFFQVKGTNQNTMANIVQRIGNIIFPPAINMISSIFPRDVAVQRLYITATQIIGLTGILSFQLNKLKEILEEEFKEATKKLDVKEKIKKIKAMFLDFMVELKNEMLNILGILNKRIPSLHVTLGYIFQKL